MGFYVKIYNNKATVINISCCTEVLADISSNKLYVNIIRANSSNSRVGIEKNGACVEVYNAVTDKLINRYIVERY